MMDKAGKKGMRGMHRLDSNDDDQISLEEFTARAATLFNTLDANQDGTVSQDEFLAKPTERFTALDTDANGLIAGDEWPRKMKGHKRWGKKGIIRTMRLRRHQAQTPRPSILPFPPKCKRPPFGGLFHIMHHPHPEKTGWLN